MKKFFFSFCCLVVLSSPLKSLGQTPAALETDNVFKGANTFSQPGVYTGPSVNDTSSVFLNGYTESSPGMPGFPPKVLSPATNAISVGGITPANAKVINITGISTRMISNCNSVNRRFCNTVGGYFVALANANGAGVWGINPIAYDSPGTTGTHLQGGEYDMTINGAPSFVRGIAILLGGSGTSPTASIGLEIGGALTGGVPALNRGIQVDDGTSALHAIQIGATLPSGANLASQMLAFARFDSGSVRHTDVSLKATSLGDLVLTVASGRGVVITNGGMIGSGSSSNSDLNGQLTFSNSTTSNAYVFGGTYTSAPICTITPLADPVGRLYISTLTNRALQLTDTSSVSITVDYQCSKRN
jgi:hypothetical protein